MKEETTTRMLELVRKRLKADNDLQAAIQEIVSEMYEANRAKEHLEAKVKELEEKVQRLEKDGPEMPRCMRFEGALVMGTRAELDRLKVTSKLRTTEGTHQVKEVVFPVLQYYYKNDNCKAADSKSPDCICWHDEGTGPCADATQEEKQKLTWRIKPLFAHEKDAK